MSLVSFQRALCDLIASPVLCLAVREDANSALAGYELTDRERKRLASVVWQRGMSTNCTLYRSNRITPIYTLLRHTCRALGVQFGVLIDEYWKVETYRDGQFRSEIERFGTFLRERIAAGTVASPYAGELLAFDLARNELEFGPRRSALRAIAGLPSPDADQPCRLHPLARLVRFRHDPEALFAALIADTTPPPDLPETEAIVVLSVAEGSMTALRLGASDLGLGESALSSPAWPAARLAPELAAAGLLVPVITADPAIASGSSFTAENAVPRNRQRSTIADRFNLNPITL